MENSNAVDIQNKKIHPFFSAPKIIFKDTPSNAIAPVTPDPSCSPNSVDDDTNPSPPTGKRKRKRRQNDDTGEASLPASASASTSTSTSISTAPAIKPKKVLKLNLSTGTIGSPPKPQTAIKSTTRRGRKPKPRLVRIRYGQDSEASRLQIGQKIDQILTGTLETTSKDASNTLPGTPPSSRDVDERPVDGLNAQKEGTQVKGTPKKSKPMKKISQVEIIAKATTIPQKATHPFFQGKPKPGTVAEEKEKPSAEPSLPKRQVLFSSTPNPSKHPRSGIPKFSMPAPGANNNGILRVPGAQHPAWPSKGMAHVRGHSPPPNLPSKANVQSDHFPSNRKAKGQQVQINEYESLLHRAALNLNLEQLREELKTSDDNEFHPPPPIIRIPSRHFESGKRLQARIHSELRTLRNSDISKTHPAITYAYNSIEKSLSAFDRSTCETISWAQKYAPSSAKRVLQSGREAELLRDWLENLKIMAVDTGAADGGSKTKAVAMAKGRGKRKKKLDGFVVSSDEEMDELSELSTAEGDWSPNGSQNNAKKTVVQSGSRRKSGGSGRFANAVVLSGPHGCGKTATVYAIAKELDFEVFEINAGGRRNGKDILEKVGDMTRNHLVQHHQKEDASKEETNPEDEVDRDLKSGRQGMMTAFFKPNAAATQKPIKKSVEASNPKETKKPAKAQKQSLILLEEVDVLYEEDKQFWATVISMISQSKRPFVMTCNDEALVPLQTLNLHGIFRFSAPPKELAVDMLLLIAANEGHALRRRAIETLYDSRGHDLRASITELNYWCQIGVGDVQGGFNWFYPRWPKGSDVDDEGNTIRVVSQHTYQSGLGWLSRDSASENSACRSAQEELHQQSYQNWGLDIYNSCPEDDFSCWAPTATKWCTSSNGRITLLESADSYASFMSDADISSTGFLATPSQISLDASIPNLPAKAREDFIVGRQLLEVSPSVQYDTLRLDLSSTLKDLARGQLRDEPTNRATNFLNPLEEVDVTAKLETHFNDLFYVEPAVARPDYSLAFDPIAASEKTMAAGYLDPSVFDRTMRAISLDVAPYVRSIVAYDQRLQQERRSRSSLLSEGGQPGKKRMRTTRSAYSALEGGSRASTRRERYFAVDVNPHLVMRTGGKGWDAIAASATDSQHTTNSPKSSPQEPEDNDDSPE
ncbi:P-loop containing nucleoside triphosphate hydrolase protein [Hypomontagnella monticulosa]|nr:P-loop containing nucleoside triphosphate hydrolase protein [Hypomontagnella monticulosa]